MMRRATDILPAGQSITADIISTVTLPFVDRHRRRIRLTDDAGEAFLLDLTEVVRLADGDGLLLDGGGIITVKAADEDVLDIQCETSAETARIAWHIGNRHIPVQVLANGGLRIAYDHVLEHMVEGLGAKVLRQQAPFSPEPGAYADEGHGHSHEH